MSIYVSKTSLTEKSLLKKTLARRPLISYWRHDCQSPIVGCTNNFLLEGGPPITYCREKHQNPIGARTNHLLIDGGPPNPTGERTITFYWRRDQQSLSGGRTNNLLLKRSPTISY
jgi:hypothetical protein